MEASGREGAAAPGPRLRPAVGPRLHRDSRGGLTLEDALGHHVTLRLVDDRVIARTPSAFRAASRAAHRAGAGRGLLAFRLVDTHGHAVLQCDRRSAGQFAHALELALRIVLDLPVPFEPARIRPVTDQKHLRFSTVYTLRQDQRHGVRLDPLHDGSSLPDLLGLRVLGTGLAERVALALPRVSPADLLPLLGAELSPLPLQLSPLADAAAGALALPDLDGQGAPRVLARRAAVQVALGSQLPVREVGDLLRITARSVRRIATEPAPDELVRAVCLQLRLRAALAAR